MASSPLNPHLATPTELQDRIAASEIEPDDGASLGMIYRVGAYDGRLAYPTRGVEAQS